MPQFPALDRLDLPCVFERVVPGRLHPDGRRYLPLIVLRLLRPEPNSRGAELLGVTDRHHLVDDRLVGRRGSARLVLLLSRIERQQGAPAKALLAEPGLAQGRASTAPEALGQVVAVPSWELRSGELPYETLYTELLLDIGAGVVGVRTNLTAPSIAGALGTLPIAPGDWLRVVRSRVDILGFVASEQ